MQTSHKLVQNVHEIDDAERWLLHISHENMNFSLSISLSVSLSVSVSRENKESICSVVSAILDFHVKNMGASFFVSSRVNIKIERE